MQYIDGGICAPKGFKAGAAMAGIKHADKYDVAVIVSEVDAAVAGVFTTNVIKAAPVLYSKKIVEAGVARAVVVNSGNANACNGERGMRDCLAMAGSTSKALGIEQNLVAVASTGVIGAPMPVGKLLQGIDLAAADLSLDGGHLTALAMMTTDTVPKEVAMKFSLGGKTVRIGGVAKGSGMIHPNMGTMLSFITTDAAIDQVLLQAALREVVENTFNMVTVDGDTSTNDTLLVLANGLSGNAKITEDGPDYRAFKRALGQVCMDLAQMIARDGEGATKFLEIEVGGTRSLEDARRAAKAIASSNLVKTAFYGEDANWGRIICALGYSGVDFNPDLVDIYLGELPVAKAGTGLEFSEEKAKEILSPKDIKVTVELNQGEFRATAWSCDLSHEYVTINGSYRT